MKIFFLILLVTICTSKSLSSCSIIEDWMINSNSTASLRLYYEPQLCLMYVNDRDEAGFAVNLTFGQSVSKLPVEWYYPTQQDSMNMFALGESYRAPPCTYVTRHHVGKLVYRNSLCAERSSGQYVKDGNFVVLHDQIVVHQDSSWWGYPDAYQGSAAIYNSSGSVMWKDKFGPRGSSSIQLERVLIKENEWGVIAKYHMDRQSDYKKMMTLYRLSDELKPIFVYEREDKRVPMMRVSWLVDKYPVVYDNYGNSDAPLFGYDWLSNSTIFTTNVTTIGSYYEPRGLLVGDYYVVIGRDNNSKDYHYFVFNRFNGDITFIEDIQTDARDLYIRRALDGTSYSYTDEQWNSFEINQETGHLSWGKSGFWKQIQERDPDQHYQLVSIHGDHLLSSKNIVYGFRTPGNHTDQGPRFKTE